MGWCVRDINRWTRGLAVHRLGVVCLCPWCSAGRESEHGSDAIATRPDICRRIAVVRDGYLVTVDQSNGGSPYEERPHGVLSVVKDAVSLMVVEVVGKRR